MSKMMRSNPKPPLPVRSPIRLRSRRVLQSSTSTIQTPPGSPAQTLLPKRHLDVEKSDLRPEYHTISCELTALTKMVFKDAEMGTAEMGEASNANKSPVFKRGRFYDEYSARRNEKLKRKLGLTGDEKKSSSAYGLGVRMESSKKETKKVGSVKKMIPSTPVTEWSEIPRYSLRSSSLKENKKPPLAMSYGMSVGGTERKIGTRRVRKI